VERRTYAKLSCERKKKEETTSMGMMNRLLLTLITICNWRTVASSHHEERQATEVKGEKER